MRLLGAILAGGQATRFGSDKALAMLGERSLIEHAAAALADVVEGTIVCGREVAPLGLIAIRDTPAPGLGPLGGLCAALRYAADHDYHAVLSIGCDTPSLPRVLIDRLVAGRRARFLRQAPIIGCWCSDLADVLATHLARGGDRSVQRWATSAGVEPIDAGGDLPNINRASDLARLAAGHAAL